MKYNILVVEDQNEISSIVSKYLISEGFNSFTAKDGFLALEMFNDIEFHLVILDVMMPGIDGFQVLKEIRLLSDVPVIMLTAKQEEADRLKGFDIGADDYVIKPFSVRELLKRVRVIIKRTYHGLDEIIYNYNDLQLHSKSMELFVRNMAVDLTVVEFNLLLTLMKNKGQVLSREKLIQLSFGMDYDGYDRNIDSYIKRIRQKIEKDPKHPELLVTKYGAGYVFGGN